MRAQLRRTNAETARPTGRPRGNRQNGAGLFSGGHHAHRHSAAHPGRMPKTLIKAGGRAGRGTTKVVRRGGHAVDGQRILFVCSANILAAGSTSATSLASVPCVGSDTSHVSNGISGEGDGFAGCW